MVHKFVVFLVTDGFLDVRKYNSCILDGNKCFREHIKVYTKCHWVEAVCDFNQGRHVSPSRKGHLNKIWRETKPFGQLRNEYFR